MNKRVTFGLLLITVIALIGIPQAMAFGGYVTDPPVTSGSRIDGSVSGKCNLCHLSPTGGGTRDKFGIDFANNGHSFTAIANMDSDGDGFTNSEELAALTFPGNASDHPIASDTTPPVITLLGSTTVNLVVGSAYSDAGATALDNKDGVLTSKIVTVNSVNTAVIGSYKVTYNVVDAAGNKAVEVVRTVNVVAAADTTPPVITLLGSTPVSIVVGSAYGDAGATALDNKDGVLTSKIVTVNSVNTAVIGSYKVTYNVVDAAGNKAVEAVRTVNVVAAQPPSEKATVKFVVTDDKTGNPIRAAKVKLGEKTIKTDNAGNALFSRVALKTYKYEVEKDGYHEIEGRITVTGDITIKLKLVNERQRRTN